MKYLYNGMAMPGWGDISGSVLLEWHEKLLVSDAPQSPLLCSLPRLSSPLNNTTDTATVYCSVAPCTCA
ncbi:hypothetical protein C8R47DRAFT_1093098 [Mycena vitilis]|nr:hypothetical protein C8R47DRAFT_1093098 [Mycena vitilis]